MCNDTHLTDHTVERHPVRSTEPADGGVADASPFDKIRHQKKRAYLAALAETGNRLRAAKMAGVHRTTPYTRQWWEDKEFQGALVIAKEHAADILEAEAYRRAVEGVEEPVGWYRGEAGGTVHKYSDTLAIFLLKALRPEKYADRMEFKAALAKLDLTQLPDHLLERIAQGEHPMAVLASVETDYPALSSGDRNTG